MEDPTANEFDLDFQVEEAWEFAAPQFYDFGDPAADDKAADRWFDHKLYDDISPELDEDEFDIEYDFGNSVPASPACSKAPLSAITTPLTPGMRSRIEERSPIREDDLMGRIVASLMPTSSYSQVPHISTSSPHSPNRTPSRTGSPATAQASDHSFQSAEPSVGSETSTTLESSASTAATAQPNLNAALHHQTTGEAPKLVSKIPSKPAAKVIQAPKHSIATNDKENASKMANSRTLSVINMKMPVPPTTLGTMKKPMVERPLPLQPTNMNRLNQVKGTGLAKLAQPKSKTAVSSKPATKLPSHRSPKILIKRQPFASQRSVIAPIRTASNQALTQSTGLGLGVSSSDSRSKSRATRVPLHQRSTPPKTQDTKATGKVGTQKSAAARVERPQEMNQETRLAYVKRPLTVAVTPELMKRRTARLKESHRLTTDQLRALEAEKQRREFFQELHRKNLNRGLAPRIAFEHSNTFGSKQAPKTSHWR
jgi:hypothetical protein